MARGCARDGTCNYVTLVRQSQCVYCKITQNRDALKINTERSADAQIATERTVTLSSAVR
eukprot:5088168-Prymnesium_polylepis.1